MLFDDFGLIEPLLRAIHIEGYTQPTPIQEQAIPHVLQGNDLLGCAQTGTGKTAAFALPILQRLNAVPHKHGAPRRIRALILTPTRELASQIVESFTTYGRFVDLRHTVVFGGVKQQNQVRALQKGVEVLVACPGRLLDLMNQGYVRLDKVEIFVLDEADRMLDMGFIDDIRRIITALPTERQTLFFSATMPREIQSLANSILRNPIEVRIAPQQVAADTVDQTVYLVERNNKQALLQHLLENQDITRALIFTRTKRSADRVVERLMRSDINAEAIHSDKPQRHRERALENFKSGKVRVLVASDIASRGLDVDDISHVINYDMPNEPETYVHRIGRTGRAGASGKAYSFCGIEERVHLDDIEKLLRKSLVTVSDHPFASPLPRAIKHQKQATPPLNNWKKTRKPPNLLSRRRGR